MQDALIVAAERWPEAGIPESPRGWLLRTAERRLIDGFRSDQARRARESAASDEPSAGDGPEHDDTLTVLFMCCHPSLTDASAIALTLRAAGGLTTREIARAFLVDETTMAQRISRAKQRIQKSGVAFAPPAAEERPARLRQVLRVLYLIFNEGYASTSGADVHRADLAEEAIRLARRLQRMLPGDGEAAGLLALMLLVDARRTARVDPAGDLVPLSEQDRSLWDADRIDEGTAVLDGAMGDGPPGEYRIQAAIAAVHDRAPDARDTDWPQILALYGLLEQVTDSPVVTLNRGVATAMAEGPRAGLAVVDGVAEQLDGHYRLHAVRAHLLEMAGELDGAREEYRIAAARTTNLPEQRYLRARAARVPAQD